MHAMIGQPIRIVIVEDETLFAKALGAWLAHDPNLEIAGYATGGNPGWELCAATLPDLVLLDVEMPDGDGLTLAKRLHDKLPAIRVIIMTGMVDPHTAWKAGQIGVQGIIDKTIKPEVLSQVVQLVAGGGRFISPSFQRLKEEWLTKPEAFHKMLTNRELTVLCQVTKGQSDPAISERLGISVETVACHRKSIRRKLNVHDDRGLVAYGRKWGI